MHDIREIQLVTIQNEHIGMLSNYVLDGWPSITEEVQKDWNHNVLLVMK